MLNTTIEVALPSPTNTTDFTASTPLAQVQTLVVRANSVYLECFTQGSSAPPTQNAYRWETIPYSWDDSNGYSFVGFVGIGSGTYVLLVKWS